MRLAPSLFLVASLLGTGAAIAAEAGPTLRTQGNATGPDEFIIGGMGLTTTFQSRAPGRPAVGLLSVEEGRYAGGKWEHIRWLNGDQTHQDRDVRNEPGRFSIQRVKLYQFR